MGIRIHKLMGYGVNNLQYTKGGHIDDPRINSDAFKKLTQGSYEFTLPKFKRWCESEKKSILEFYNRNYPWRKIDDDDDIYWKLAMSSGEENGWGIGNSIIHDGEYGMPEVLIFIPPGCKGWYRYDDILDYEEESVFNRQRSWVRRIEGCLYPWVGWVRYRPAPKGVTIPDKLEPAYYSQMAGDWDEKRKALLVGDALAHLKKDYRPQIPLELAAVIYYFREVFADVDAFYNELRPYMYVYWS